MDHKILIVEDAKIIALHLQKILENAGYHNIVSANSGEKALKLVEEGAPDLILMDIMLSSDLDGIDTMKLIQEKKDIPVIYLTALTDKMTVDRAKETKPYGYIIKPFEAEQVITLMEMAINKYSGEFLLEQSEQKFKAAVSAITDCFIYLDEEFKIQFINKATERLINTTVDDVVEKNLYEVFEFFDYQTGQKQINLWHNSPNEDTIRLKQMFIYNHNDEKVPIGNGVVAKVLNHKNQLKGVVLTFSDYTDKVREQGFDEELKKKQLSSIIEGQEQERSRIARELHDGLGQSLNGIKLQLSKIKVAPDNQSIISDLQSLINESIQETSRISENLLPSKLKNFDISTCLFSLVNHDYPGFKISFESTGVQNEKIDLQKKINIYRIVQELIANCIKHAEAENLSIQLRGEGKKLALTVEDDGVGFDFMEQKKKLLEGHNGLQNIMDRVGIMDGKIDFDTSESNGFIAIIEIPY